MAQAVQPASEGTVPVNLPEDDMGEDEHFPEHDRCQWDVIRNIPLPKYKDLLLSLQFAEGMSCPYIIGQALGSFHYALTIMVLNKDGRQESFVVKVPGHGTQDQWTPEDAYMLEREVETMQVILSRTLIPVPEVMAWSSMLENDAGFPFIDMRHLPAESSSRIWFEQPYNPNTAHELADTPSLET
jgi:hypothetical protein